MRWLGIIALSLLALVPTSSSIGDKSTSTHPSTIPSANNETDYSSTMLNSTGTSTILTDTESTADRPIDNLTTVITVLEEGKTLEQGTDIEYSLTHNVLEPTPSREDDKEVKDDETGSSQVDNVQAEPSRSRDVESQPQSGESPPAQATNSSDLDKFSADELEVKLNEAKTELERAKNVTESVKKARDNKQEELKRANDDYEEKKKKWEELDKIAKAKAEIWTEAENNATTANSKYEDAKTSFNNAVQSLSDEQGVLDEFPAKIKSATEKLETIKKRPERLIELETTRTNKINGKPQLQPIIDRLSLEATAKKGEWETVRDKFEVVKAKYELDNCNDPAKALPSCPATAASKAKYEPLVGPAKEAHEQAEKVLAAARKELADYDKDLSKIEDEIEDLITDSKEPTLGEDIAAAERELASIVRKEGSQTKKVENWKVLKQRADEDQELKRVANETAYEKVKNGRPPEIEAAKSEATHASITLDSANDTRIKVEEELKKLETDLNGAKATETKLESEVGKLENAYAEARKKEKEEPRKSSIGLYIGLSVVFVVLLAVGIVIAVVLIRRRRIKGNRAAGKKGTNVEKKTLKQSQSVVATQPGSKASTASTVSQASAQPPAQPAVPSTTPAITTQPQPVASGQVVQENDADNEEEEGTSAARPIPDYRYKKFVPGEKPFKIPAKNFKWLSWLRRKTRWHGEPKHLLEGKNGPEKLDKIWFDKNANFAVQTGSGEVMENTGPPSDSSRSEHLDYLDEWEKGREAMLELEKAESVPNPTPSQKAETKKKRKFFLKLARECAKKKLEHSKPCRDEAAGRKKTGKSKRAKRRSDSR